MQETEIYIFPFVLHKNTWQIKWLSTWLSIIFQLISETSKWLIVDPLIHWWHQETNNKQG